MNNAKETKVFIAYSRVDIEFLIELKKFLSPLTRNRYIDTWYDGEIIPGEVWEDKIKQALHTAEIFLLLVSADSLASDYFYNTEVSNALERHHKGESIVIPVILKPCGWKETPLADLQSLPLNGKPLNTWANKDEAYESIYEGLKHVIKKIQAKKDLIEKGGKGDVDKSAENVPPPAQSAGARRLVTNPVSEGHTSLLVENHGASEDKREKPNTLKYWLIGLSLIACILFIINLSNKDHGLPKEAASDTVAEQAVPVQTANTGYETKITGKIYYNNEVITKYSNAQAVFELMDVRTRSLAPVNTQYNKQTGEFVIENVPPGKYTPFVRVESGYPFEIESGGDYFSRISGLNDDIVVAPGTKEISKDFKVMHVIHLTKPVDSQELRTSTDDSFEKLYLPPYGPSADKFVWDAVPGANYYQVYFILMDKNSKAQIENKSDRITSAQYSPNLNVTAGNNYYMFRVEAYNSKADHIGTFTNYYKNGSGGWFQFTVAASH